MECTKPLLNVSLPWTCRPGPLQRSNAALRPNQEERVRPKSESSLLQETRPEPPSRYEPRLSVGSPPLKSVFEENNRYDSDVNHNEPKRPNYEMLQQQTSPKQLLQDPSSSSPRTNGTAPVRSACVVLLRWLNDFFSWPFSFFHHFLFLLLLFSLGVDLCCGFLVPRGRARCVASSRTKNSSPLASMGQNELRSMCPAQWAEGKESTCTLVASSVDRTCCLGASFLITMVPDR
jgi:hypothetical protein